MKDFSNVSFKGVFRDYQQRVLDSKNLYLVNGKINIVAAPGSGKTILGLELIKQLGETTIILSPTTTIKHQWGERFESSFLPEQSIISDYVSYDLNNIKLINSITYQALYSVMNKIKCESEDEVIDYSGIDLFDMMRKFNIKTICLDEAHHLQNEWEKALEKFISGLDKDIKIVALTATPPYDASKSEWERYIKICGDIDEEIFVPELVAENTLCPHQDYIYFNYPSRKELGVFEEYKIKVFRTLKCINDLNIYDSILEKINTLYSNGSEYIYENVKFIVSLLVLLKNEGYDINQKLVRAMIRDQKLPSFNLEFAEKAVQFLLNDTVLLNNEQKEQVIKILKTNSTYEYMKVCFSLKEGLKKKLVSSVGKLDSIDSIVTHEYSSLKEDLRLLILTDYIRKETIKDVGTDNELTSINLVTIFEHLRRKNDGVYIGVLSGGLVILPSSFDMLITEKHTTRKLNNTNYSVFNFSGNNKGKVEIVGKLFEEGKINVLIGTKSLLGEGWDSPCINVLILATFIGSFMLSNQMRGRAIRKDPKNPNKESDIWHLVTLEPDYIFKDKLTERFAAYKNHDYTRITSYDYNIVEKRFDSFVGPNYLTGDIESGIDRITIITEPYTPSNIKKINKEMLFRALNKEAIKANWENSLKYSKELSVEADVPTEVIIPPKTFVNAFGLMIAMMLQSSSITGLVLGLLRTKIDDFAQKIVFFMLLILVFLISTYVFGFLISKIIRRISNVKVLKLIAVSTLKTLQEIGEISYIANVKVNAKFNDLIVRLSLDNASIREQNVFNSATNELLGFIENPRYVLIMKKGFRPSYMFSFACPEIIGQKKEYVETFTKFLKKNLSYFEYFYTRNEQGRKILLKCRHNSFITYNDKLIKNRKKIVNY